MVASAPALDAALPGIYINAEIGRPMLTGLAVVQEPGRRGRARHYVVVGLGTNGPSPPARSGSCAGPSGRAAISSWSTPSGRSPGNPRSTRRWLRPPGTASTPNWPTGTGHREPSLAALAGRHPPAAGRRRLYARVVLTAITARVQRPAALVPGLPERISLRPHAKVRDVVRDEECQLAPSSGGS